MTTDQKAFNFYFKQTGKTIADNSRPDMVIGYVAGYNERQQQIDTFKRLADAREAKIRELEQRLEDIRRAVK